MNPYAILAIVVAFGLVLAAAGVQTYRLQGSQNTVALMEQDKEQAAENERLRVKQNVRLKERIDEDDRAARARAAASIVRVEPAPGQTGISAPAGFGQEPAVCFDGRKLDQELAGYHERLAARLTGIAQSSESVAAAFRSCKGWALDLSGVPASDPSERPALTALWGVALSERGERYPYSWSTLRETRPGLSR